MIGSRSRYTLADILPFLFLMACIALVLFCSFSELTTRPKIFYDEGLTIEVARNFQLFGKPDVLTSPGQFSGVPYVTGSTGFPVSLPLAGFFSFFGFGLTQARIYALGWLILFFVVTFFFSRKVFGPFASISSLALLTTFPPLYDSGRRVLGEIPGFSFLLLGTYLLFYRRQYFIGGILLGLAAASKPSIYSLALVSVILVLAIIEREHLWRKLFVFISGAAPMIALWFIFAVPDLLSLETWRGLIGFYSNPFGSGYSVVSSVQENIKMFFWHSTLIYFTLLSLPILAVFRWSDKFREERRLRAFFLIYGALILVYFLKSPGWLRYLLPLQLLILLFLPTAILEIAERMKSLFSILAKISTRVMVASAVAGLFAIQLISLVWFSDIYASRDTEEVLALVHSRSGDNSIGVINSPQIAAFLPPEKKYHFLQLNNKIIVGENPLLRPSSQLFPLLILPEPEEGLVISSDALGALQENYELIKSVGRWQVFLLRN